MRLEEAVEALFENGLNNRALVADVLAALSGLSKGEVAFNVDLVFKEGIEPMKITREQREEAKAKIEKYEAKTAEAQKTLKDWEYAERKEPPRDHEDVTGYIIEDDGTVTKLCKSKAQEAAKAAKGDLK